MRQLNLDLLHELSLIRDSKRTELRELLVSLAVVWVLTAVGLLITIVSLIIAAHKARNRNRELGALYERLSATIEGSFDGIVVTDFNDRILHFSRAAEKIFGMDKAQALGRRLSSFLAHPCDATDFAEYRQKYLPAYFLSSNMVCLLL